MRHLLCAACVKDKPVGTRQIYAPSISGEPAEFERVVVGTARTPLRSQRYIKVNDKREDLSLDFYNCDLCHAEIRPGDPCGTHTVWTEHTGPIVPWEHEYMADIVEPV